MRFLFLLVVLVSLCTEEKALPVGQEGNNKDVRTQCIHELLSVLAKPDGQKLQPKCIEILNTGASHIPPTKNAEDVLPSDQNEKKHQVKSDELAQEVFEELLRESEKNHEDMYEERSQEEFPNYYKRLLPGTENHEDPEDERSQEEFPQKRHYFLSSKEKQEDQDDERSQEEFPTYEQKIHHLIENKEKRNDPDYDRSQEDFPSFLYKRYNFLTGREKGDNPVYDQTLEDLTKKKERDKRYWRPGHKYHARRRHKRNEDMDSEEEEKMSYNQKQPKHNEESLEENFEEPLEKIPELGGREKGNNADYDQSFEDFIEKKERDKRYWRPSDKYHARRRHKRVEDTDNKEEEKMTYNQKQPKHYEESLEENFEEPLEKIPELGGREKGNNADYDQSLENFIEKKERDKRYWRPGDKYHARRRHKRDEDMDSEEEEKMSHNQKQPKHYEESLEENFEEPLEKVPELEGREKGNNPDYDQGLENIIEKKERDKRYWRPSDKYHARRRHKRNEDMDSEEEEKMSYNQKQPKHYEESLEENFEEQPLEKIPELSEKSDMRGIGIRKPTQRNYYPSDEQMKKHYSPAEEQKQKNEAVLRYLTKKRNELEEHLQKEGEDYEKSNPWVYQGYYQPAWNEKRPEENERHADPNAAQTLEKLASALQYKIGQLLNEGGKAYIPQSALTPEESKVLNKLAAVEQLHQIH